MLSIRHLALVPTLAGMLAFDSLALGQSLAQPRPYYLAQEDYLSEDEDENPSELGPSDEGDDESATLEESEEEGFETEPVGTARGAISRRRKR